MLEVLADSILIHSAYRQQKKTDQRIMLSCPRCSWHKFTLTLNFYPHHFFSATSIKSQVCEVVRVIRTSLYQIHALFYCDEEGGEKEFKGYLFYIYNIYNIGIHTKWQLDRKHKFSISKKKNNKA